MKQIVASIIVMVALTSSALACPACGPVKKDDPSGSKATTIGVTAGMILLPISMATCFAVWVSRSQRIQKP